MGDFSHLGFHTRSGDNSAAAAIDNGASHIDHVFPVPKRNLAGCAGGQNIRCFIDRDRFSGQRCFFDFHAGALKNPSVRRNSIARFENYNITGYELLALFHFHFPAAHHLRRGCRDLLQSFNRFLCLALLQNTEHRINDDNGENNDHISVRFAFIRRCDAGNQRCGEQDQDHRVFQLFEKPLQIALLFSRRQPVRSVFGKPPRSFRLGKSLLRCL